MVQRGDVIGTRARGPGPLCPDCPAVLGNVLSAMVQEAPSGCLLGCASVPARGMLPESSAAPPGLALVRRGIVVRQRVDASGSATAIDAVGPGGLLPLRDGGYAATDVLFCAIPPRDLAETLESSIATAHDVIRLLSHALERVERIADARGRKTAAGRVAALLGALVDMLSPYRRYDLVPVGLRQRDLAALLAIRHESVCRELRTLESSGAVARVTEGIRIIDRAKLDAVG